MSQDDVRLSPELIAKLNALATYLTEQGEYEAVDLIDTVVARVSAMPQRELLREALEENKRLREALTNLLASLDRLGDNGVYVIDTGLAHAYAASLVALEHQQKEDAK